MKHIIFAHSHCTDGLCAASIMKRAINICLNTEDVTVVFVRYGNEKAALEAVEIDKKLRKKAADDHARFEHLRANREKREKKAAKTSADKEKRSKSWAEKLEKMREKHPNAYRPWTDEQDALLKQEFQLGSGPAKLSQLLGRHERSIILRLQKLLGEDVVQL